MQLAGDDGVAVLDEPAPSQEPSHLVILYTAQQSDDTAMIGVRGGGSRGHAPPPQKIMKTRKSENSSKLREQPFVEEFSEMWVEWGQGHLVGCCRARLVLSGTKVDSCFADFSPVLSGKHGRAPPRKSISPRTPMTAMQRRVEFTGSWAGGWGRG